MPGSDSLRSTLLRASLAAALATLVSACPVTPPAGCENNDACADGQICDPDQKTCVTPATDGGVDGGDDAGVDAGDGGGEVVIVRPPEDTTLFVSRIGDGRGSLQLSYTDTDGTPVSRESAETFSEIVLEGTEITLVATPEPGSRFEGWVGATCTATAQGCTFKVETLSYVTARFARAVNLTVGVEGDGTGKVRSEPTGLSCPGTCEAEFSSGSEVRLIPEPAEDSLFAGWSGACVGEGTCVVPLSESRSVTARFMPRVRLSVSKDGLGNGTISSTPAGLECGQTCEADFVGGSTVRLSASSDATSIFMGWSGACSGTGPCTVDMDSAKSVKAIFQGTFRLTVVKQGAGQGEVTGAPAGIDCGTSCSFNYRENEQVTLTAAAAPGSVFSGWGGACAGTTGATCTVTLNQVRNVIARFILVYPLNVKMEGDGTGAVTSLPAGINCGTSCTATYPSGTNVTLTAVPGPQSIFSHWSGACSGTSACPTTVSNITNVVAHFKALLPVTVTKTGAGSGRLISNPAGIDCGEGCSSATATFPSGTEVRILNSNLPGSRLFDWDDAACPNVKPEGTCLVKVDAPINVAVEYQPTYVLTLTKSGAGVGTVTSEPVGLACGNTSTSCTADFFNEPVKLKADPSTTAKSVFNGWTGCGTPPAGETPAPNECWVTMSAAKAVGVNFLAGHELTVTRGGSTAGGDVSVTSSPAGMACTLKSTSSTGCKTIFKEGQPVTLTATVPATLAFTGWTCPSSQSEGCPCSGTGTTCTVPVTSSRTLIANVQPLMVLTLVKQGTGSAAIKSSTGEVLCAESETTCTKTYPSGTEVTFSVDPDNKTSFNGWADLCVATGTNPGFGACTVTMSGARTATARLVQAWPRRFGAIKVSNGAGTEDGSALAVDSAGNIVIGGQIGGVVDFGGPNSVGEGTRGLGFLAKYAPDGTHLWSRTLSNPGGESRVNAVAVDQVGNVVAVGFFGNGGFGDGTNHPNTGSNDAFVAKYNGANGTLLWASFVSTSGTDDLLSVAVDSNGNVIAAGHVAVGTLGTAIPRPAKVGLPTELAGTDEDAVVLKYTATGSILSAKRLAEPGLSAARAVTVDGDNIVFVGGTFDGTQTLGGAAPLTASGRDAFLLQLGPTLEVATVKHYANTAGIAGTFHESVDGLAYMGPNSFGIAMIGSYSGTANIGSYSLANGGFANVFVARIQSGDLAPAWARGFPGTPYDVAVDATGRILMAGSFGGTINPTGGKAITAFNSQDAFVGRVDGNGDPESTAFTVRYGANNNDRALQVAASGGQVVILGDYSSPLVGANAVAPSKDLYVRDAKDAFLHVVTP